MGFKITAKTIYDVLVTSSLNGSIMKRDNAPDFIASTSDLTGAEIELVGIENREFRLKNALVGIRTAYDYIFIDCPPSLGLLTVNALAASDSVLIPLQCEFYALEGLGKLLNTLKYVRDAFNEKLHIKGVMLTMFDGRLNLSNRVAEEIRDFFGEKLFETAIPRNVRLAEAPSFGKDIYEYDKTSSGSVAYIELGREFLKRERSKA